MLGRYFEHSIHWGKPTLILPNYDLLLLSQSITNSYDVLSYIIEDFSKNQSMLVLAPFLFQNQIQHQNKFGSFYYNFRTN